MNPEKIKTELIKKISDGLEIETLPNNQYNIITPFLLLNNDHMEFSFGNGIIEYDKKVDGFYTVADEEITEEQIAQFIFDKITNFK